MIQWKGKVNMSKGSTTGAIIRIIKIASGGRRK